jgi:hypothetical protein
LSIIVRLRPLSKLWGSLQDDPDALTARIETTTLAFIDDIERFLAEQPPS